jgi:hypothetical protein
MLGDETRPSACARRPVPSGGAEGGCGILRLAAMVNIVAVTPSGVGTSGWAHPLPMPAASAQLRRCFGLNALAMESPLRSATPVPTRASWTSSSATGCLSRTWWWTWSATSRRPPSPPPGRWSQASPGPLARGPWGPRDPRGPSPRTQGPRTPGAHGTSGLVDPRGRRDPKVRRDEGSRAAGPWGRLFTRARPVPTTGTTSTMARAPASCL